MKRVVAAALLLASCMTTSSGDTQLLVLQSGEGELEVQVEIADTQQERMQGLMYREDLPEGTGMLFVFEEEQLRSFWMKNTLIPLDIIFFDAEGQFVSSQTMYPCTAEASSDCTQYPSRGPAMFALEVPQGFVELHDINDSWSIDAQAFLSQNL